MFSILRHATWTSPVVATLLAIACVAQEPASLDYEVPNSGLITAIDMPQLACGKAGKLVSVARRGSQVKKFGIIAQIDTTEAQLAYEAQEITYNIAEKEAANDVDIRYAKAQAGVTKYDLQTAIDANRRSLGAVAESQVNSLRFQNRRSELAIEQAQRDRLVKMMTAQRELANLNIAKQELEGRQIKAPFDGEVVQELRQNGEWATPGDPVIKFIRLDRLQVEGRVEVDKWAPNETMGRPVTIAVLVGRNKKEIIETTVSYVSPEVSSQRTYAIAAEFDNPSPNDGNFVIRPGMQAASIVIHFGREAIGTARAEDANELPLTTLRP